MATDVTLAMIGRSRWANAVASAGTRAIAPPSTRSCTAAMGAVEASIASMIASASRLSKLSMNIVRSAAIGRKSSSSGG